MAGHAMCPSSNKRVSITFFRVRPESIQGQSPPTSPMNGAMTLWQPSIPSPYPMPNGAALSGYEPMDSNSMPNWGDLRSPVVMLAPMRPMVLSPKRMPNGGGTGVFLPWAVGSRKPAKHLPPRAQRGRLLALSSPVEAHVAGSASDTEEGIRGIDVSLNQTQKIKVQRAVQQLESLYSKANSNASVTVADTVPVSYEGTILQGHGTSEREGEVVATLRGVVERAEVRNCQNDRSLQLQAESQKYGKQKVKAERRMLMTKRKGSHLSFETQSIPGD
ncbi:unnamed protein product [Dovyalis caffra]|uniref:Uncharacterized protein n=1 Tax=Dovyalis caffra TaxID=77055 RepID=A0AAV1SB50_9ROSI|nr:unnamed protein product [Dovyalis caffra]